MNYNDLPENYTIIDIETTGFSVKSDKIIEFAGIKIRNNQIVEEFQQLINPSTRILLPTERLTGISNHMIANEPTIDEAIQHIIEWIGDDVIAGHNITFDVNFLNADSNRVLGANISNKLMDTLTLCKNLYPDTSHALSDMLEALGIEGSKCSHRALPDCKDTYLLIQAIRTNQKITKIVKPKPKNRQINPSATTKSLMILQSVISDIIEDNKVTEEEFFDLKEWLSDNKQLMGNFPYDVTASAVNAILEDGIVEQYELDELLLFLKEQLDPVEAKSLKNSDVCYSGKSVCLTGEFCNGTKADYEAKLSEHGAIVTKGITKKTDYLIVGGIGSDRWSNGNYGNKVKKALEMQEKGHFIVILRESDVKLDDIAPKYTEQLSLFDDVEENPDVSVDINVNNELNNIVSKVASEQDTTTEAFAVKENKGDYSITFDNMLVIKVDKAYKTIFANTSVLSRKTAAEIKEVANPQGFGKARIEDITELSKLIFTILSEFVDKYMPTDYFGCCHLYEQCSDAGKCISEDKLRALKCYYRTNLKKGRIFYGKNANI